LKRGAVWRILSFSLIGAILGNYRITGELSRGGMGTVFRAEHEILKRPAAVKLLRPELSENDELVERFFNEAKAATAIRHPGIVEIYDFGYTDEGHAYLVMEFLEGRVLSKELERHGRLAEFEAASIARGIASALKAAHGKGIIHRDLKPDNVFLVPDLEGPTGGMRAKVLDFGIAKLSEMQTNNHTQTGVLMGTPLYMAPEQARAAGQIDQRADLYSLGCILYEMLVGRPPFLAEGAGEIIAMQLFTEPTPPRTLVPDISREMEMIVMRLLAKEPRDRFQSAGDVVAALGAAGARLSSELASMPGSGSYAMKVSTIATPANGVRVSLIDDATTRRDPPKRSAMPIIAGILTLAIAVAVAIAVYTLASSDDAPGEPVKQTEPQGTTRKPSQQTPDPEPVLKPFPTTVVTPPAPTPTPAPPVLKPFPKPAAPATVPRAGGGSARPAVTPQGPMTPNGSPIETDLDDTPKKKP
jgi:serine/threonine protein kinase